MGDGGGGFQKKVVGLGVAPNAPPSLWETLISYLVPWSILRPLDSGPDKKSAQESN